MKSMEPNPGSPESVRTESSGWGRDEPGPRPRWTVALRGLLGAKRDLGGTGKPILQGTKCSPRGGLLTPWVSCNIASPLLPDSTIPALSRRDHPTPPQQPPQPATFLPASGPCTSCTCSWTAFFVCLFLFWEK